MQPAMTAAAAALTDVGRDGLKVAAGLALVVVVPVVLLIAAAGALVATLFSTPLPIPGATFADAGSVPGVPPDQLAMMQAVERASGVPWELLAAIASVESDFGRNMATSSAGAIGYGQFLPSSWAAFGEGGNPYDYRDAIPAMARYLVASGAPADIPGAVYAYNHSWDYVATVLERASHYATEATTAGALMGTEAAP